MTQLELIPLTLPERDRLGELEAIVERGLETFVEVGMALSSIRRETLYRETHGTFEAYCRERWGMTYRHANRLVQAANVAELVGPIGPITNEAQARELVPLLEDEAELVDTWRELKAQHGDRLTADKVRTAVADRLRTEATSAHTLRVMGSSASDEWPTPQKLFDLLDREFGMELDVCATDENAKCTNYFTRTDDGLQQEWRGNVWMNPPYGEHIGDWVAKAATSANAGATVVTLLPARVDTAWWWDHCRFGEIRFLRGRLKFGGGEFSAPFPSAVVIFGRPPAVKWWEAWPE